jgi:hypothetical protein
MDAPALLKREGLVAVRLGAEEASDRIEDATKTCGGDEGFEPAHGPVALLNAPMVVLQAIIPTTPLDLLLGIMPFAVRKERPVVSLLHPCDQA